LNKRTPFLFLLCVGCGDYGLAPDYERIMAVEDLDGDGFAADVDCSPRDPRVNPGATEIPYNGIDDDCDSATPDDDLDGDGFMQNEDCDDLRSAHHPGATESCDQLDEDCDGVIDEELGDLWYADADQDGFGDPDTQARGCDRPTGWLPTASDCDDQDANVHPGAAERCNDKDDDCDQVIDEGLTQSWFADRDGDGFGDPDTTLEDCDLPEQGVSNDTDCDDTRADVFPHAEEFCDGLDSDCDATVDEHASDARLWYLDHDGDGFGNTAYPWTDCDGGDTWVTDPGDCDDDNETVNALADELCDGIDNDCDGAIDDSAALDQTTWFLDADSDDFGVSTTTVQSCVQPSGYAAESGDCDDSDPGTHPAAAEICNDGADNDCDGTDNGCTLVGELDLALADQAFYGASTSGGLAVVQGVGDLNGDGLPDLGFGVPEETTLLDSASFSVPYSGACGTLDDDGRLEQTTGAVWLVYSTATAVQTPWGEFGTSYGRLDEVADAWVIGQGSMDTTRTCGFDDELGTAVASGDLDGDGYMDLLIGAPEHDHDPTDRDDSTGAAYVFYGPLGTGSLAYDAKLYASDDGLRAGFAGLVTDLDADGLAEWVTGAIGDSGGSTFVIPGSTSRLSAESEFTSEGVRIRGAESGDQAGAALVSCDLGSPDGSGPDGVQDLVIGVPGWFDDRGAAAVLYGPIAADSGQELEQVASAWIAGTAEDDYAANALACGDLDGDGQDDLIIAAQGSAEGADYAADLHVWLGPLGLGDRDLSSADFSITGESSTGLHSSGTPTAAVAMAGDINGDGYQDLVIGRPYHDPFGESRDDNERAGSAWVLYGPLTSDVVLPVATQAGFKLTGDDWDDQAGFDVAAAGDLNGDGYDDLVIAARLGDDPDGSWDPDGTGGGCTRVDLGCCSAPAGAAYVIYGRGL
jgi:hypothetical protein